MVSSCLFIFIIYLFIYRYDNRDNSVGSLLSRLSADTGAIQVRLMEMEIMMMMIEMMMMVVIMMMIITGGDGGEGGDPAARHLHPHPLHHHLAR